MEQEQVCFVTWVTRNSIVSEAKVALRDPDYVEGAEPIAFGYQSQLIVAKLLVYAFHHAELEVLTFTILPDHVHLLAKVGPEKLDHKINTVKDLVTQEIRRSSQKDDAIWAVGFDHQWIDDDDEVQKMKRYIQVNHLKHVSSWGKDFLCGYGYELREIIKKL